MTNQNDKLDEILDRFFRTFWETPSLTYEQAKKQAELAILNWAKEWALKNVVINARKLDGILVWWVSSKELCNKNELLKEIIQANPLKLKETTIK